MSGDWQPIETLPPRKVVEGLRVNGSIVVGKRPPSRGKVRDVNTIVGPDGLRYVCTHWRYPSARGEQVSK